MATDSAPGPIAVIDVETTGLFPNRQDRVVEVAVVVAQLDGTIEREFVSLVNPDRDIGPSRIHGLASEDVLAAPRFEQIAGHLLNALRGVTAVAAHNIRFDQQFLVAEFARIGCVLPQFHGICSMQLAGGGNLADCCELHGVVVEGKRHSALVDARSTAKLLSALLADLPREVQLLRQQSPVRWPSIAVPQSAPLTRDEAHARQALAPTFVQKLLQRRRDHALPEASDGAIIAYGALLDRALEDRNVDDREAAALVETAVRWGLTDNQVEYSHRVYLNQLVVAAVADGAVSEAERRDLKLVARLLGQGTVDLDGIIGEAAAKLSENEMAPRLAPQTGKRLQGMRVCFTGELQGNHEGRPVSREVAEEIAAKAGLVVVSSVTKSCDLLVLADPNSQSGKAKKARGYGIRIMHEPVFWKAIGMNL